jgi:hypothetical protein
VNKVIPAGAVTGIGSLPHTSAASAIQAVAELSPEIPFWPQLPQRAKQELAIIQGLGLLSGLIEPRAEGYGFQVKAGRIDSALATLHRSDGQLAPTHAAGFQAFEEASFPSAVAVKGQVEGPITLATYLFHNNRPFLSEPALFAAIAFHVSQTICWQIDRLKSTGYPVLLFIDEPALCLAPDENRLSALAVLLNDVRTRGAIAGLHCCAARPFEQMCLARPDILSFDAYDGLERFFTDPHAQEFLRHGGTVAYGLVPTWPSLDSLNPMILFTRWLTAASLVGDPQELARQAMITATCGLGLLNTDSAIASFRLAQSLGNLIRALANTV